MFIEINHHTHVELLNRFISSQIILLRKQTKMIITCIICGNRRLTRYDILKICFEIMPKRHTNSINSVAEPNKRSYDHHMFTPDQLRAARALLNWSQDDLASAAGVAVMMIKNYERKLSDPRLSSMTKLKATLEKAGIEFIDATDVAGAGLRWSIPRSAAAKDIG